MTHFFAPRPQMGSIAHMDPKPPQKLLVHVQAITPNPWVKIVFSKLKGLNPPLIALDVYIIWAHILKTIKLIKLIKLFNQVITISIVLFPISSSPKSGEGPIDSLTWTELKALATTSACSLDESVKIQRSLQIRNRSF